MRHDGDQKAIDFQHAKPIAYYRSCILDMLEAVTRIYRVLRRISEREGTAVVPRVIEIYTYRLRDDRPDIVLVSFVPDVQDRRPGQVLRDKAIAQFVGVGLARLRSDTPGGGCRVKACRRCHRLPVSMVYATPGCSGSNRPRRRPS